MYTVMHVPANNYDMLLMFRVSFGFPDETTLRAFAHSDYATISGDQIRSTHILVLPNIRVS